MFNESHRRVMAVAVYGILLLLCCLTVYRLAKVFLQELFIDFWAYYDVSLAICKGLNPYVPGNLTTRNWGDIPIVFPGYAFLIWPFLLVSVHAASILFLLINLLLGVLLFFSVYKRCIDQTEKKFNKTEWDRPFCFLLFLVYFNSSPFLMSLRHGQTTIIIGCCLFGLLMFQSIYLRYFCFAVCACLKYSILPFIAFALFFKGHYKLCIVSFILFVAMALFPACFGMNLLELYRSYVTVLSEQMQGGFNTFAVSGYNMLQFDMFRLGIINTLVKAAFALTGAYIIYREFRQNNFSLELLLVLSCITMLLSYNRLYNLVFVVLILTVELMVLVKQNRLYHALVAASWLVFFLVPFSVILKAANILGGLMPVGHIVYLGKYDAMHSIFPIMPILMFVLTVYALILYMSTPQKSQTQLDLNQSGVVKDG